jgi:uncharacterized protein YjiS (DUF1127 family)
MIGTHAKARPLRSGAGWIAAVVRSGSQVFETLAEMHRASEERAQLLTLSERELRDIGINRIDAIREAEKPLRRWRTH